MKRIKNDISSPVKEERTNLISDEQLAELLTKSEQAKAAPAPEEGQEDENPLSPPRTKLTVEGLGEVEVKEMPDKHVLNDRGLAPSIEIENLYKAYGKKLVIKGLDMTVYPGEVFGFLGKNGVGKSTTIDCLIGCKDFQSGNIYINGYDVKQEPIEAKKCFGYVSSEPDCYETMTGYEYLDFIASVYGIGEVDYKNNVRYLANRLDLKDEDLSLPSSGYSHGMKQKLCLIASLIHTPEVWILDEPTVGLDVMAVEELTKMLREYADNGQTVLLTSHNIDLVGAISDRVAILNEGKVAVTLDLKANPNHRLGLRRTFFEIYGRGGKDKNA